MDTFQTLYRTRGASAAVAAALGISQAAVSQWRAKGIPADRLPMVEQVLRDHLATCPAPKLAKAEAA
jgi:DNA-binding transcriptional regulator YdaS (Cro superfamily)